MVVCNGCRNIFINSVHLHDCFIAGRSKSAVIQIRCALIELSITYLFFAQSQKWRIFFFGNLMKVKKNPMPIPEQKQID